jgi:hypothetical protein
MLQAVPAMRYVNVHTQLPSAAATGTSRIEARRCDVSEPSHGLMPVSRAACVRQSVALNPISANAARKPHPERVPIL